MAWDSIFVVLLNIYSSSLLPEIRAKMLFLFKNEQEKIWKAVVRELIPYGFTFKQGDEMILLSGVKTQTNGSAVASYREHLHRKIVSYVSKMNQFDIKCYFYQGCCLLYFNLN